MLLIQRKDGAGVADETASQAFEVIDEKNVTWRRHRGIIQKMASGVAEAQIKQ